MSIVVNSDFVGKFELSITQFNTDLIDSYIDRYEKIYLTKLLGVELYNLFIADLDVNNVPQTTKYETIYNALSVDVYNEVLFSYGMKDLILGVVYYNYTKDNVVKQTPIGSVKSKAENSEVMFNNQWLTNRYNESLESFKAIQHYILQNENDYPTFNGQVIKYEYFL